MGVLTSLLTAPLKAPVTGPLWVARRIAEAVDRERNDPAALRAALRDAELALLDRRISEDAYDAIEDDILARLSGVGS